MDIKERKKSYSDLEAIIIPSSSAQDPHPDSSSSSHAPQVLGGRKSYWNEKFLAEPSSDPEPLLPGGSSRSSEKNGVFGGFDSSPVDTLPPPPPAYYLVDSKGQTQALYTVPTNNGSDTDSVMNYKVGGGGPTGGYNAATPPAPMGWWKSMGQGQRILGMRKNVFLAACAGLCVLILGLLLTVLLVTHTINPGGRGGGDAGGSGDGPVPGGQVPPGFSTPVLLAQNDVGAMLTGTNVASMNWTDLSTGTAYTGVFYQSSRDTDMSLMAAIKNEATGTWTSVNISASAGGSNNSPLDVLPGTPLAAANNNGLWNLVYLSSSFALQEVYATDPTSTTGWLKGEMASKLGNPIVVPGSGLGAMWQSCSSCDNALFVMWQDGASMSIMYANMTNLTWGDPIMISDTGAPGSRVAVSAFTDYSGTGDTGADKNAVRFYYEDGDGLYEMMKGPLGGGNLVAGNFGKPIAKDLSVSPSPAIASLTYGAEATGWTNNLLAYIDPWKGSVTAVNWQGSEWKVAVPTLRDAPDGLDDAGFSSVALTQSMRVYMMCPAMGQIHEFTVNSTDPTEWNWNESITL